MLRDGNPDLTEDQVLREDSDSLGDQDSDFTKSEDLLPYTLIEDDDEASPIAGPPSSNIFKPCSFGPQLASRNTRQRALSSVDVEILLTEPQAQFLLDTYMQGYHPLVPVVHAPSFLEQCQHLLREGVTPNGEETWDSLGLMLAVCFAGAIASPAKQLAQYFQDIPKKTIAREMRRASMRCVREAGFPHTPTLRTLTAYIICQSTWLRGQCSLERNVLLY
jgi:hypothetical protein